MADGSVSGTNRDAFAGGFVAAIVQDKALDECVDMGHWLASLSIRELGPRYVLCDSTRPFPNRAVFLRSVRGSFICGLPLFEGVHTASAKNVGQKGTEHVTSPSRGRSQEHGIPEKEIHKETPPGSLLSTTSTCFLTFLSSLISFPSITPPSPFHLATHFISSHMDNLILPPTGSPFSVSRYLIRIHFPSFPSLSFHASTKKEKTHELTDSTNHALGNENSYPFPKQTFKPSSSATSSS